MTTLANAITETPSLDGLRLRALAYETLKAYERDPRKAIVAFLAAVRSDRNLLFELIGYAAARERAFIYLDGAAADMAGGEAQGPVERRPGARSSPAATETEGGEAQLSFDRHDHDRASPSAPVSDDGDARVRLERLDDGRSLSSEAPSEEARKRIERRPDTRSSPSDDGNAHPQDERHLDLRSPSSAPIPLPKRGAAELRSIKAVAPKSAFDSIVLRDRRSIGDLQWSAIDRFIRDNTYESALLRQVKDYAQPADPNARIRDVVPLSEFERMVQQAAEHATADAQ